MIGFMRKIYKLKALMLFIMFFVISKSSLFSQINLTATAGTATGSYATVSAAFAAINAGTHQGDIVISVDGNTTEPAAPVYLGANGVSTALFTSVLIKPSVIATIAGAPNAGSAVINFNGSDNVIIDGSITVGGTTRDLTISNSNLATIANTAAIRMIGQTTAGTGLAVTNFTIKNNVIVGNTPGNNGTSGSIVTTAFGIYAGSNSLTTMSATTAGANYDNITIENNEIKKAYYGVSINGGVSPNQNDNLIIRNNTIGSSTLSDQIGFKGIYAYQTNTGLIENNVVSNIKVTSAISVAGIEVGGTASNLVTVSRNRIEGIQCSTTSGAYGINLVGGTNHIVVNNVITDVQTTNNFISQLSNAIGIRITSGTGIKVYYNSVNLFGAYPTSTTTAYSAALAITSTTVTGLEIMNNIFSNKTTSLTTGAQEHMAIWFPSAYNFLNANLNNNYYGVPNDAQHFIGKIGVTAGTGLANNLSSWQLLSQVNNATNDNQSDPVSNFVVPFTSNLDLTIPAGTITAIESGGVQIVSLGLPNVDFLLTNRPALGGTAPDMGAYENATLPITCPQPTNISIASANFTDATVAWIAGGAETSWQLQYGLNGFALGTGTSTIVSTNPATISGLTTNSFYQVYVRAICGPGDTSFWTGPITFNTYNQGLYMDWDNACPTANFINIAATGTDLLLTDDSEAGLTLPWSLLFQGTLVNDITVGNNGGIILGTQSGAVGYGGTMSALGNSLWLWGDDLDDETGNVYHQTIGTAPNRTFIVQWDNICNFSGSLTAPTVTFQLQIDEATQEIFYVYSDVVFGGTNVLDDYADNADIGVGGPNQDITVSQDNPTYLQNNSCAHFFYTDCPKPTAFTISYILPDEAAFSWTTGLAGETNWTIIYGPAGFDPATGGTTITSTTLGATLPGLTQLTCYDVYIYSDCSPTLQSDVALFGTFCTLPFCSNPSGMVNTTDVDSIFTSWSWTESSPAYPSTGFNLQYGMNGFPLYTGTIVNADNNLTDTIANPALLAGGVYQVYVQAVCGLDTSTFVGPFTVTMPLTNDTVCGAETLMADGTIYTFNNTGATVETGETAIAPPATGAQTTTGWINSSLNNTTWFKFVAPASGSVRVNNTAINYAGQSAVYDASSCSDFATFSLVAANDNAIGGTSVAPNYTVCGLTPGAEYYLMHDGSTATVGNYSISITPIVLNAGSFANILDVCAGDTVNLFDGITGQDAGGLWTAELASAGTGVTDSLFASAGLAFQVFNFEYRLTDGCAYDSIVAQVEIYGPSSAGNDGTVTVCRNEPYDLLSGLTGNVDLNGSWYNPSNQLMSSSWITAGNIPGQFNYDYITGNGVCPDDTANVLVNVDPSCNYLDVAEMYFGSISLYPNPTNGMVYITNEGSTEVFNFEILDIDGRVIASENAAINGTTTTEINLQGKVTGMYMIRVYNDNAEKVFRVILQ
jgi:hypothetical protein